MRLEWSRAADADIFRIWRFNAERNVDLADRIEQRLHGAAALIRSCPRIGRPVAGEELRELSVPDVQSRITYRLEAERILIVRILHARESRDAS